MGAYSFSHSALWLGINQLYSYRWGSLHWHLDNHMTVSVPLKLSWKIWLNILHKSIGIKAQHSFYWTLQLIISFQKRHVLFKSEKRYSGTTVPDLTNSYLVFSSTNINDNFNFNIRKSPRAGVSQIINVWQTLYDSFTYWKKKHFDQKEEVRIFISHIQ